MAKLKGSSNWTQFRVLSHKNLILAAKCVTRHAHAAAPVVVSVQAHDCWVLPQRCVSRCIWCQPCHGARAC